MPQDLGLVFGPRKPVFGPRFWALFPPGLPQFLLLTAAALRPSIHRGDAYLKYEFKWASPSVAPLKNGPTPKAFRRKTYLGNGTFAVVSAGRAGPGRFGKRFFRNKFGNRRTSRNGDSVPPGYLRDSNISTRLTTSRRMTASAEANRGEHFPTIPIDPTDCRKLAERGDF